MKTSLTFKTAVTVFATTTIAFATPAAAHDNGYVHQHQSSSGGDQLLGAGIGAIAGGVLGSQLAANGARTEGSVLGAVIGGVAGAAIAGDGSSNRRVYNQGYYNPQTGYYNGGGYYRTAPGYSYQHQGYRTYGHAPQPYYGYSTNYPHRTYTTTTYRVGSPYYGHVGYSPYYRAPRTGLTINIGSNGYRNRGHYRRHYNRGHRHTRHCRH